MINVQGKFNEGRGASGLHVDRTYRATTRMGTGTPRGNRPPRLTGTPGRAFQSVKPGDPRARIFVPPSVRPNRAAVLRNRKQFMNWLKNWAPQLYTNAKRAADVQQAREGTLNGLSGWFDGFMEKVADVGGKYLQFSTQKEILDAQMERMRQGLPPLQTAEYAPTVKVDVGADTTREITGAIGTGFKSALPWIAGGVGVGLLLLSGRKKR